MPTVTVSFEPEAEIAELLTETVTCPLKETPDADPAATYPMNVPATVKLPADPVIIIEPLAPVVVPGCGPTVTCPPPSDAVRSLVFIVTMPPLTVIAKSPETCCAGDPLVMKVVLLAVIVSAGGPVVNTTPRFPLKPDSDGSGLSVPEIDPLRPAELTMTLP